MMIRCQKAQALLQKFATGDLPTAAQVLVEAHLEQCESCRLEFETEMELLVNLGELPLVPCPQPITNNILTRIEIVERRQNTAGNHWLLATSTLVAAGLALVLLLPGTTPTTPPETYSHREIITATKEAQWALAKVATVINRNEKNAFEQVFRKEIPGAVGGSLHRITKNLQGEV